MKNRLVNIFPAGSKKLEMFEQMLREYPQIPEMPEEPPMAELMESMSEEYKKMSKLHLDVENNAIPCDHRTFYCWMMIVGEDRRIVKHTNVGTVLVSTVFLTKDQRIWYSKGSVAQLFETYVFDGIGKGVKEKYATWQQAAEGHERWVQTVTEYN
jgi:hypothetical protein